MALKDWEARVLARPGAPDRVNAIEHELRLAAALAALRRAAKVSQRELARRLGVSQPRVAQIERSADLTVDTLTRYVEALDAHLEITAVDGDRRIPIA